ncbi:MAG: TorD/DmsD family molecular chaperone [archaeon]
MRKNTILGKPPSGTSPGPDNVVPGVGPREKDPDDVSTPSDDETPPRDVPGSTTTAFHRSRVYSVLSLGFERPGDPLQAAIDDDIFGSDLVQSAQVIDDDMAEIARDVARSVDDVDVHHDQWASLFGVEEGVTVSPYELTYMPGPLMTNVRKLADIAGFYDAFDLEIVPEWNDRRDHVCFQLEFLGHLSLREAYLRTEGDAAGVAVVGDVRRQFVEGHLGRWYWRFVEEVSKRDDGFYASLADFLAVLLQNEIDRLDVDPEWVPDDPTITEWSEDIFGDSGRSCGGCGVDPQGVAEDPSGIRDLPHRERGDERSTDTPGRGGPESDMESDTR